MPSNVMRRNHVSKTCLSRRSSADERRRFQIFIVAAEVSKWAPKMKNVSPCSTYENSLEPMRQPQISTGMIVSVFRLIFERFVTLLTNTSYDFHILFHKSVESHATLKVSL